METIPTQTTWIPQGIPTGVFVPNNQTPAPVEAPVVQSPTQWAPVQAQASATPTSPVARPLDKVFAGIVRFVARITGQPDPITGTPNISKTAKTAENIVGKVRNAANQAVEKASDVATKATATVEKATEKIQQVIPPPAAPQAPATPTVPEQNK